MKQRIRYSAEVRERAVRMVAEHEREYDSQWAAIRSIAEKIACAAETLRKWIRQAERDAGRRPGLTTEERERVRELERENRELRRARIRSTASCMGEPECNGLAERFLQTLQGERPYLHDFGSLKEARQEIEDFIERYNRGWPVERYGCRTPAQARQESTQRTA